MAAWPSGLRRLVQVVVRKGVSSNLTAVTFSGFLIVYMLRCIPPHTMYCTTFYEDMIPGKLLIIRKMNLLHEFFANECGAVGYIPFCAIIERSDHRSTSDEQV